MRWRHLALADVEGSLVSLLGVGDNLGALVTRGNLGEVAEVVTLHLQVENLALRVAGLGNQVVVQEGLDNVNTKEIISSSEIDGIAA